MAPITPIGTPQAKIAFVGERSSLKETQRRTPFIGPPGEELDRMLWEAGILLSPKVEGNFAHQKALRLERETSCYSTKVFLTAPPEGNMELWCVSKVDAAVAYGTELPRLKAAWPDFPWPSGYSFPHLLGSGKYLHPKHLDCLPRLKAELDDLPGCNVVVALGPIACWALLGDPSIKKNRGITTMGTLVEKKIVTTFAPDHVLRTWQSRVITIADLMKARRQLRFPELVSPPCEVWVNPTIQDLYDFDERYLKDADIISVDIETKMEQVRCVGFAASTDRALVVPFLDLLKRGYSYWKNPKDEILAWLWVAEVLARPTAVLGQNFNFDLQYFLQKVGIPVRNIEHDTMLLHHSLHPELEKSLGFMGSIYTDFGQWKSMRLEADLKDD